MAEETKTDGPRKGCPWCRKAAIKVVELGDLTDIKGEVRFKAKCSHCGKPITIILGEETRIYVRVIKTVGPVVAILLIVLMTTITAATLILNIKNNFNIAYMLSNYDLPFPNQK